MKLTFFAVVLVAGQAVAEPVFANLEIVGPNDAGQVLFPMVTADGGVTRVLALRVKGNLPSTLDAVSVIDGANVFDVEGMTPRSLPADPSSTTVTLHFKPFNQVGQFSGRLAIDWNDFHRDDSIVLCGVSVAEVDGGLAAPCAPPARAPARPLAPAQPAQGCSASAAAGVTIFALLGWLRLRRTSAAASR